MGFGQWLNFGPMARFSTTLHVCSLTRSVNRDPTVLVPLGAYKQQEALLDSILSQNPREIADIITHFLVSRLL